MADSKEKLFSDFPAVSTEQWMEKITADLKGADFERNWFGEPTKVLSKPFYRQEDLEGLKTTEGLPGEFPYVRGTKKNDNTWFVRQEIKVECPKEANAKALDILNKGVDSLGFYVKKKDLSPEYIETLLNDICAECIELNFSTCQGHTVELAKLLVAYFLQERRDCNESSSNGDCRIEYCCGCGFVLWLERPDRAAYDGGYSLWCSNEHAGTGCCQRSVEPAELQWPADSDGICVRLSIGSAGYHWFYYCYPLHLPD